MNKGICFHFGYMLRPSEQARMIKDHGFDVVMTSGDKRFNKQNGNLKTQVKLFKENGLGLSSLHMTYKNDELPEFFKDSKIGDKIEKSLEKDIKSANKYGFSCVVVHLKGEASEVGFARVKRLLNFAQKYDVPLAIENLDNQKLFVEIFDKIEHPYLKFCYDIGHNNCFTPNFDFLKAYKDKLVCLHLHSNDQTRDMHTLNKYGNVDWDNFARELAGVDRPINLDYEILMRYRQNETPEEVLAEVYRQAQELEELIEKYKNNKNNKNNKKKEL